MRLDEAKRDHFRKLAKAEGYRSRAAYKLKQINDKYHLIRTNSSVVDIGCAPGGWLEVASEIVGERGRVVGVDMVGVKSLDRKNVRVLKEDITSMGFFDKLKTELGKSKADCVLADLSPKLSGIWDMDHFRQIELCHKVVDMLPELLVENGSCVMKAFHGSDLGTLILRLRASFGRLDVSKPEASRKESSEVYLVSTQFKGLVPARQSVSQEEAPKSESPEDSDEFVLQDDLLREA